MEILGSVSATSAHLPKIAAISRFLFNFVNESMMLFLSDEASSSALASFLSMFFDCITTRSIAADLSVFVISLLLSDFESAPFHRPMLDVVGAFLRNNVFPPFEAVGGLLSLWELLLSDAKDEVCDYVFGRIDRICWFRNDSSQSLFALVVKTFTALPDQHAVKTFRFLFGVIANAKVDLLSPFISQGGFFHINRYIQAKNDKRYLVVYDICLKSILELSPDMFRYGAQLLDDAPPNHKGSCCCERSCSR
jgi:hypothetical protein